ncbi:hypothetical protein M1116_02740 [Patescibacteria group bacterium]|nr:hypothetical protein [Patescibacteria group bacterium]
MKDLIYDAVKDSTSLPDLAKKLIAYLKKFSHNGATPIGFVAGIINSDGPDLVEKNKQRLASFTQQICTQVSFPVFSCLDVYEGELRQIITASGATHNDYLLFWRQVLESGFITDLFLTPGWERSRGVQDEYETAKSMVINIHKLTCS